MTNKFFLVDLTYIRPLEEVDALKDAHIEFLKQQYAQGYFIFSGPKEPRDGGVILAKMQTRNALDAVLALDPFKKAGVARYGVTEFSPVMCADGFKDFIDTP
ncbi:MAG: hypothetical protein JKY27_00700 [Magnetovibrio sp.]|nr:hypothetical protein [Magnetovibrio sp.]